MSLKPIKYVLVPISTIGCGKTTVSVALTKIFPESMGMISNDDLNNPKQFYTKSKQTLNTLPAVIMDKNNHQKTHRNAIFEAYDTVKDQVNVKFIALNFIDFDPKDKEFWNITTKRVIDRGDNHQKLKIGSGDTSHIYRIMRMFVNKFEPLDLKEGPDTKFDFVINLKVDDSPNSSLANVKLIIDGLIKEFPQLIKERPRQETIEECYLQALNFKPTIKQKPPKKQAPSKVIKKSQPVKTKI